MANFSLLEEKDRYFNWYHGFTQIKLPYYDFVYGNGVSNSLYTSAASGNIMTKYFGEKFNAEMVETHI